MEWKQGAKTLVHSFSTPIQTSSRASACVGSLGTPPLRGSQAHTDHPSSHHKPGTTDRHTGRAFILGPRIKGWDGECHKASMENVVPVLTLKEPSSISKQRSGRAHLPWESSLGIDREGVQCTFTHWRHFLPVSWTWSALGGGVLHGPLYPPEAVSLCFSSPSPSSMWNQPVCCWVVWIYRVVHENQYYFIFYRVDLSLKTLSTFACVYRIWGYLGFLTVFSSLGTWGRGAVTLLHIPSPAISSSLLTEGHR
jgi:hypothetical protein